MAESVENFESASESLSQSETTTIESDDGLTGLFVSLVNEVVTSPLNIALLAVCLILIYKILFTRKSEISVPLTDDLPPLKKTDMTLEQIREYDGTAHDGRILIAVNGKVFDVTRGKNFYGPGGPYGVFAGRDASRGLATFSLGADSIRDEYDDLTDLSTMQMESVREWEGQFTDKYDLVGKLLRPGEQPQDYTDTEEDTSVTSDPDQNNLKKEK